MLEPGERRATAVSADPHAIGFHRSALDSWLGWKSWQLIARGWLATQRSKQMLRAARNTQLGETRVESGKAPEWQPPGERREAYGGAQITEGRLFLTAGDDVQKDRIEIDFLGLAPQAGKLARRPHRHRGRAGSCGSLRRLIIPSPAFGHGSVCARAAGVASWR